MSLGLKPPQISNENQKNTKIMQISPKLGSGKMANTLKKTRPEHEKHVCCDTS